MGGGQMGMCGCEGVWVCGCASVDVFWVSVSVCVYVFLWLDECDWVCGCVGDIK